MSIRVCCNVEDLLITGGQVYMEWNGFMVASFYEAPNAARYSINQIDGESVWLEGKTSQELLMKMGISHRVIF